MDYEPRDILQLIAEADAGLLDDTASKTVSGFAGDKLTGLIQRLTRLLSKDYLEIGVFQGSSLLHTALCNPSITCFGIDNFDFFDPDNRNKNIVVERAKKLNVQNYEIIDKDFEIGLKEFEGNVGVYFIDGPHDYRSQLMCLAYGRKILSASGCIVVDDANYGHVRQATKDFIYMNPDFKLVFEAYTDCHPYNMNAKQKAEAKAGWWDGVHLIVHDPENNFVGLDPAVPQNSRFIRDHQVHITGHASVAAEAALLMASLSKPWRLPKSIARYLTARKARAGDIQNSYFTCNTDSGNLETRTAKIVA